MEVGLSMLFCLSHPFRRLLKELETVDVRYVELIDEGLHTLNRRRVSAIKKIVQARDLSVAVHAPFVDINLASPADLIRRVVLSRLKKSILLSSQLNSKFWVFHPGLQTGISHIYPGLDWDLNLKSTRELLDTARKCGVKITVENGLDPFPFLLKRVDDFVKFYRDLGEYDLGLTLDVGHANISGQIYEFIDRFPNKIVHVHVHDNHGKFDHHLGIGNGNINWLRVVQMLKAVRYEGALIIESETNVEESLQTLKTMLRSV